MPRKPRYDFCDTYHHVMNRRVERRKIFFRDKDYQDFIRLLREACDLCEIDLHAYCLMPNHFHLLLKVKVDGEMGRFMHWIQGNHTKYYRWKNHTLGEGALYQSRYKSFLLRKEEDLKKVWRYVERNPLTGNLVKDSQDWKFSSLTQRIFNTHGPRLVDAPFELPKNWLDFVNEPLTEKEIARFQKALHASSSY